MRIYKLYVALLFCGLLAVSCNDWLDVRPETEQKEEEQFSTYKGFRDALTGCYMAMGARDAYGQRLTMSNIESLAGLWHIPNQPYGERLADYNLNKHDYTNDDAREAVQAIYSKLFNIILQTNLIIKYAEADAEVFPDEAIRSVILGEAYALRAYCQLDVLRLFGDVPGSTGKVSLPYSEVTAFNERPSRYDFNGYVEKLLEDLSKAENLLKDNDPIFHYTFNELIYPESYTDLEDDYMFYRQGRLNYWAVKALQARTYLYIGKKDLAYQTAKSILQAKDKNGDPVMTLSGSKDRSDGYKNCPNECLFYLAKNDVKEAASILIGGRDMQASSNLLYLTTAKLGQLFEGVPTDSDNRYAYLWNKNVRSQAAAILKYYFADDAENKVLYHQIIPMLRLSEVYLIAIETTEDITEANELFDEYLLSGCDVALGGDIFTRLSDIPAYLLNEYRREFFAEGQMFYTYKRNRSTNILWSNDDEITDEDYILWNCVNTEFNP